MDNTAVTKDAWLRRMQLNKPFRSFVHLRKKSLFYLQNNILGPELRKMDYGGIPVAGFIRTITATRDSNNIYFLHWAGTHVTEN